MKTIIFGVYSFCLLANKSCAVVPIISIPESMWNYYSSGNNSETHGDGMVGWTFSVQNPVTITHVGWHDRDGDGLSRAFQVGLWQSVAGGTFEIGSTVVELLGTSGSGVFVPAGTSGELIDRFRAIRLTSPLLLQPGVYQIGGLDTAGTPDPITYIWDPGMGIMNTPDVRVGPFFYANMTGSGYPPMTSGFSWVDRRYFYLATGVEMGPMLFTVPEPNSASLLVTSVALMMFGRRKR